MEKAWLTSNLFSTKYSSLIVICLGEVRLQVHFDKLLENKPPDKKPREFKLQLSRKARALFKVGCILVEAWRAPLFPPLSFILPWPAKIWANRWDRPGQLVEHGLKVSPHTSKGHSCVEDERALIRDPAGLIRTMGINVIGCYLCPNLNVQSPD